ncbi:MAG: hypothetical protein ACRDX9_10805 [Acidimicrobiia bacterium]
MRSSLVPVGGDRPAFRLITTLSFVSLLLVSAAPLSAQFWADSSKIVRRPQEAGARVYKGRYAGVYFEILPDNAAWFNHYPGYTVQPLWSATCKEDAITDVFSCAITNRSGGLLIVKDEGLQSFVAIGKDHFPGSRVFARVDGGGPFASDDFGWVGDEAKAVIQAMTGGSEAVLRYTEWPYRTPKDIEVDLFGLGVAVRYVDEVLGARTAEP